MIPPPWPVRPGSFSSSGDLLPARQALERLPGVVRVEKGFFQSGEINTVDYDPAGINVTDLENALKKSGTYLNNIRSR